MSALINGSLDSVLAAAALVTTIALINQFFFFHAKGLATQSLKPPLSVASGDAQRV